jgi:RecJ-like exonuclease
MIIFSSCDKNSLFSSTESISIILESPSKYDNKIVRVRGKVTESLLVFGVGYFVISDESSSIAVIPSRTFPKVGEEVKIRGTVKNAFVIGDKSLTVIMEEGT